MPIPSKRREPSGLLKLTGCTGPNLQNISVDFPLGVLCLVTGVSAAARAHGARYLYLPHVALGQAAIGRMPFDD